MGAWIPAWIIVGPFIAVLYLTVAFRGPSSSSAGSSKPISPEDDVYRIARGAGVDTISEWSKPVSPESITEWSRPVKPGAISQLSRSVSPGSVATLSKQVSASSISSMSAFKFSRLIGLPLLTGGRR